MASVIIHHNYLKHKIMGGLSCLVGRQRNVEHLNITIVVTAGMCNSIELRRQLILPRAQALAGKISHGRLLYLRHRHTSKKKPNAKAHLGVAKTDGM